MGGDLGLDGIEPGGPHAPTPHPPSRAAHDAVREALSAPLVGAARADYILDALRRLPVEQRMEAMGMRPCKVSVPQYAVPEFQHEETMWVVAE